MRGLVRPCRHALAPELRDRWRAHLCGLCLTLRDEAGQASRVLTGYDVLLLSVLVEAQAGEVATETAAPCALRGMRTATVVAADAPAARLAAAGGLLTGAAGVTDKLSDRDLRGPVRPVARRAADRFERSGARLAGELGLVTDDVLEAPARAAALESRPDASLDELLEPTGAAVAVLFAHTAEVSGRPANAGPLGRAGDAFGRLVHLADAVTDVDDDRAAGRHNALLATGTTLDEARRLAESLHGTVVRELAAAEFADRDLLDALLDKTLERSVRRTFAAPDPAAAAAGGVLVTAAAVAVAATAAVFGGPGRRRNRYGPPWGAGQQYDPRYDPRYDPGYDPRYDPRYGYGRGFGRGGPSCLQLLACDCCVNAACDDCCGGGGDDCCVCCI